MSTFCREGNCHEMLNHHESGLSAFTSYNLTLSDNLKVTIYDSTGRFTHSSKHPGMIFTVY